MDGRQQNTAVGALSEESSALFGCDWVVRERKVGAAATEWCRRLVRPRRGGAEGWEEWMRVWALDEAGKNTTYPQQWIGREKLCLVTL